MFFSIDLDALALAVVKAEVPIVKDTAYLFARARLAVASARLYSTYARHAAALDHDSVHMLTACATDHLTAALLWRELAKRRRAKLQLRVAA